MLKPTHRPCVVSSSLPPSNDGETVDNTALLRRQLLLLLSIRCLRTANLAQPIIVPYYSTARENGGIGLSPTSVLWLGSLYSAFVTVAEMPSGFISDFLGRRRTLLIAFLCIGSSCISTALAPSLMLSGREHMIMWIALVISQLFRALGSALFSGTDMALLYEVLQKYKRSSENGKADENAGTNEAVLNIESRHVFFTTSTEAAFAVAGGIVSTLLGLRATVAAASLPFLVGAGVCLYLEDDTPPSLSLKNKQTCGGNERGKTGKEKINDNLSKKESPQKSQVHLRRKLPTGETESKSSTKICGGEKPSDHNSRALFFSKLVAHVPPRLRTIFFVGVALNCGTYMASTALNPLLWTATSIPVPHFGLIGALNGCVSAFASLLAPTLKRLASKNAKLAEEAEGTQGLLNVLLFTSTMAYGLMVAATQLSGSWLAIAMAVGASVLLSIVRGVAWPALGSAINAAVRDNGSRATTLSIFAGAVKVGMVGAGFILGLILGEAPPGRGGRTGMISASNAIPGLSEACTVCALSLAFVGLWLKGSRNLE